MNITEIRVKLMGSFDDPNNKLKAFCSVTFSDEIVVRDLKVIEGAKGLFVAMPSRKLMSRCASCRCKNPLRARYCNGCGGQLEQEDEAASPGRRLYADVTHPINRRAREDLQEAIVAAYEQEVLASEQEGYVPQSFDDLDYEEESFVIPAKPPRRGHRSDVKRVEPSRDEPGDGDEEEMGAI